MISKEELKKEVDKLPENLLDEVYAFLKRVILQKKTGTAPGLDTSWNNWKNNLAKFTPDFMNNREQAPRQNRESFD